MKASVSNFLVSLVLAVACAVPAMAADPHVADTLGKDWSRVPEYRIVPGDRLSLDLGPREIAFDDYVRDVTVRPDGRITVYPIGDVVAAGYTPMELQKSITALLSADLRAPRITVEVRESAANQVHVFGQVTRAGSYAALPFMTVSQAIAAAGGFTNDASRNSVLLIHRDGARTVRVARVRMEKLLKGSDPFDPMVGRFDIVYVPRSSVANVSQFLNQLFSGVLMANNAAFVGWELFNLDAVFDARVIRQ